MEPSFRVDELSEVESLRLVSRARVGRVVYTEAALPAITPVNFALDDRAVVFRTRSDSRLARAVDNAVVAFEVDNVRYEPGPWWSVVILGMAAVCADVSELIRAQQAKVTPWVGGSRECYVRIVPSVVTGRRLVPIEPVAVGT